MATVRIGTASWADKPVIQSGKFYPEDANTPEERLRYYYVQDKRSARGPYPIALQIA